MTMEDREFEALLRSVPLRQPSIAMDAKVMARRPRRSSLKLTIFSSGALAAAAALVLAVSLGWFGHSTSTPVAPGGDKARVVDQAANTDLMPTKITSDIKVTNTKVLPGDNTNPNPVREIRTNESQTVEWVGRDGSIHIEHKLKPHTEEIHLPETPVD